MGMQVKAIRRVVCGLAAASAVAVGGVAVGAPVSGAAAATGTTAITWAEPPGSSPNYIFPFMGSAYYTVWNNDTFQFMMYRPLYWFGKGSSPDLNPTLSLAAVPKYSNGNTTVTITLKSYKWSDGEAVDATDVMFWMNMLHAEKTNWAGYVPGGAGIPTDVTAISITSPTRLTFTLTRSFNTYWYTYNELSQIIPMPLAWTITATGQAAGSGGCARAAYGTDDAACKAVYTFLSEQSGYDPTKPSATNNALPTYATNPIWQVVDGPWHLASFGATASAVLKPNPSYSGPVKPTVKEFVEKPFTTDSAEYNALVGGQIDVGYLPTQDVTANTTTALKPGKNNPRLAATFRLTPIYAWAINYFPYNFNSTGDHGEAGKIFRQLYFRQAMQSLVDQPVYISRLGHGYGVPTYGPVPVEPHSSLISAEEKSNPYPYDPAKAKDLLKSHGWKVVPNGTDTCVKPGTGKNECGAGIAKGARLAFTIQYESGDSQVKNLMDAEKGSWATAGIDISLSSDSFDTVVGNAVQCPKGCSWELENWGAGWVYGPDFYPSGTELFATGAEINSGLYSTATNDALIKATETTTTKLTTWENYLAKQLPVIWQPEWPYSLTEVHDGLKGVSPQNPVEELTPASWRWTS